MFGIVSILCGLLVAGLTLPFVAMGAGAVKAGTRTLEYLPAELEIPPTALRSKILMADGSLLAEFYDENRVPVPLDKIAPVMQQAQIAIEDHRFYEHGAIDLYGTMRAFVGNMMGGSTQGGSTLTQQYVKQVRIEAARLNNDEEGVRKAQEQTLERKFIEMRYAMALENKFSKDEILNRYLNIAYYGDGAYGVEAAARHYFDTTAAELTLPQAAMLAGLVQNPNATDPVNNPRAAIERRDVVLNQMAAHGYISEQERDAAKKVDFDRSKVKYAQRGCISSRYPFICDYIERTLVQGKVLGGKTDQDNVNLLQRGGFTIQTLIDPKAQDGAEKAVASLIDPRDPVLGTVVMMQPSTGLIVAMAQSRPQMGDGAGQTYWNYNVKRSMGGTEGYQAGSTFKVFTAAAALDKGMSVEKSYYSPSGMQFKGQTFKNCKGPFKLGESYAPGNSTRSGRFSMVEATKWSVNTYFIQLERDAGICETVRMAEAAGVERADGKDFVDDDPHYDTVPAFTLGVAEITPLSMTRAYSTFANRGVRCDPIILKSVTSRDGKEIPVPQGNCQRAVREDVADGVNYLLKRTIEEGTGRPARVPGDYDQAGKTGTIDSNEAVWFAGYTPDLAAVSMVAVDKTNPFWKNHRRSLKNLQLPYKKTWLSGSGSGDAGRIWQQAVREALPNTPKSNFHKPDEAILKGRKVTVPSVENLTLEQTQKTLDDAGLNTQILYVSSGRPKGTYLGISQSPGTQVPAGTTIYLRVSQGYYDQPGVRRAPAPAKTSADAPANPPARAPQPANPPAKPKENRGR